MTLAALIFQAVGMTLQVFDMAFWAQKDPVQMNAEPVYEEVVQTAFFPQGGDTFWGKAPEYEKWATFFPYLTQAACPSPPGNPDPIPDMCTAALKGYFIAPHDGEYRFTLKAESDKASLFLGEADGRWQETKLIASLKGAKSFGEHLGGNASRSAAIRLQKGKAYPIYAVEWFVHGMGFQIQVQGPGLEDNPIIPSEYLCPLYDKVVPSPPTAVATPVVKRNEVMLQPEEWKVWSKAAMWSGYRIYVDGKLQDEVPIKEEHLWVRNLKADHSYQIGITNVDELGQESAPYTLTVRTARRDSASYAIEQIPTITLKLSRDSLCEFTGLGLNADMMSGRLFSDSAYYQRVVDAKPGLLRWGALEANVYAFEKAYGPDAHRAPTSIGNARQTHARNMDLCNRIGAAYSICIGMKDGPGGLGGGDRLDYTVDYVKDPQTFLHLIEYLAGPADSPYGSVRAKEGFQEPLLTPKKGRLLLEMGNESWGGRAHNAPLAEDYTAYGRWCRDMARLIHSSPYWPQVKDRITIVYSGRNVRNQESYGLNERLLQEDKGEIPAVAYSGYLGGNMNYDPHVKYGRDVKSYFKERHKQMQLNLDDMRQKWSQQDAKQIYLYESQVSTAAYFGTMGQGIVLLDYLISSLHYGSIWPSIFSINGGEWRIMLDNGTPFAHYTLIQKINQQCQGVLMRHATEEKFPPVGSAVFRNGKQWAILLFSRDFTRPYQVGIQLPKGLKKCKASVWELNAEDMSTRTGFHTSTRSLRLRNGSQILVPAHSVQLITFQE